MKKLILFLITFFTLFLVLKTNADLYNISEEDNGLDPIYVEISINNVAGYDGFTTNKNDTFYFGAFLVNAKVCPTGFTIYNGNIMGCNGGTFSVSSLPTNNTFPLSIFSSSGNLTTSDFSFYTPPEVTNDNLLTFSGGKVEITSNTVNLSNNSAKDFLASYFQILKFLGIMGLISAGFLVLNKIFSIIPNKK